MSGFHGNTIWRLLCEGYFQLQTALWHLLLRWYDRGRVWPRSHRDEALFFIIFFMPKSFHGPSLSIISLSGGKLQKHFVIVTGDVMSIMNEKNNNCQVRPIAKKIIFFFLVYSQILVSNFLTKYSNKFKLHRMDSIQMQKSRLVALILTTDLSPYWLYKLNPPKKQLV